MLYALWKLWRDRNNRVFRNKSNYMDEVAHSIVWSFSEWVRIRMEFKGIDLLMISIDLGRLF